MLKFISINIIAAISWPPPLISQLFSPRLFKAAPFFHSLAVFVWIIITNTFRNTYMHRIQKIHATKSYKRLYNTLSWFFCLPAENTKKAGFKAGKPALLLAYTNTERNDIYNKNSHAVKKGCNLRNGLGEKL